MSMGKKNKYSRLLAHQLRQRTVNQAISEVRNDQGVKCTDNLEINKCFLKYYQSLYITSSASDNIALENFFERLDICSLGRMRRLVWRTQFLPSKLKWQ